MIYFSYSSLKISKQKKKDNKSGGSAKYHAYAIVWKLINERIIDINSLDTNTIDVYNQYVLFVSYFSMLYIFLL